MVASTPSGSTPSNGSSSSRTSGEWKAASTTDIRRPMPWREAGGDPVGDRRRGRSGRAGRAARSCHAGRHAAQRGGELEVLPRRGPRDQPADVGAVADPRLGRRRVARTASTPPTRTDPHVGGRTPASTRSVVDLPAPLRPTSATEAPARQRQVEPVDGDDRAEAHREVADLDDGGHAASDVSPTVDAVGGATQE